MRATAGTRTSSRLAPNGREALARAPRLGLDVARLCLIGLIVMAISRINQYFAWMTVLRPGLLLAGVAFAALAFIPSAAADKSWIRRPTTKMVIGIGLLSLGSIAFGISQGGAWYAFSQNFSKVLLTAFLLVAAIRNMRDMQIFVWAYVIGAGLLVWLSLFVY